MKLKIENKKLTILDKEEIRTGNEKTYELEIESSEEYQKCACSVTFKIGNNYVRREVVKDKVTIPYISEVPSFNKIYIGFFGIYVENGKVLEINSANLDYLNVVQGSFKKYIQLSEDLEPTVLEQYLQEMKVSLAEYNENAAQAEENLKQIQKSVSEDKTEVEEIKNSVEESEVNAKASEENSLEYLNETKNIAQSMSFASLEIDTETGELVINTPERFGNCGFSLNEETGNLEVDIDG